ncbi:phosphodiesterase [Kineococcus glutinatus]|uniref:Phosphodiesterase n=1 Tax=Kineococcus glutinatus TaxID=1070872 RepID=A0ABP9HPI1_9ACTN
MAVPERPDTTSAPAPPGTADAEHPDAAPPLAALGTVMAQVARLRTRRPREAVHTAGLTHPGVVHRGGLQVRVGVPWLDSPGRDEVVVRLSKGAGLPAGWRDLLGLALRVPGDDGRPWDLLLSSAGLSPLGRHLPAPRRDPLTSAYTTFFAHRSPAGPLMVAAIPARPGPGWVLAVAERRGPWRPFARLEVDTGRVLPDPVFDPVLHALPGLPPGPRMTAARRVAYAGSRRGRGARLDAA